MCLILFAYKMHPEYPLIVAANRDEFFQRPTAPVHFWDDEPNILAGQDLEKMGTWMGVTKFGRFAALTNYRDPSENIVGKRSRGELVRNALTFKGEISDFFKIVQAESKQFPGFNFIVGDKDQLYYFSNIEGIIRELTPGIYGLSNHLLNTPWPKVEVGRDNFRKLLNKNVTDLPDELFKLLMKADPFPDGLLPNTGVPIEMERMLSPLFIKSDDYGTRSSTVMLMSNNEVSYIERIYQPEAKGERRFCISIVKWKEK